LDYPCERPLWIVVICINEKAILRNTVDGKILYSVIVMRKITFIKVVV